jgi:cytochrome c oxidase subunit 4
MAAAHGAHEASSGHHGVGHVVPLRVLFLVWGALIVLTWVTVAATFFDLGNFNIFIALGIAVIKSSLVVLYFMHLRYDNPFNGIIFVISILFVMLFISFTLIDSKEYSPEMIPGYSPAMDQAASQAASPAPAAGETAAPPAKAH